MSSWVAQSSSPDLLPFTPLLTLSPSSSSDRPLIHSFILEEQLGLRHCPWCCPCILRAALQTKPQCPHCTGGQREPREAKQPTPGQPLSVRLPVCPQHGVCVCVSIRVSTPGPAPRRALPHTCCPHLRRGSAAAVWCPSSCFLVLLYFPWLCGLGQAPCFVLCKMRISPKHVQSSQ